MARIQGWSKAVKLSSQGISGMATGDSSEASRRNGGSGGGDNRYRKTGFEGGEEAIRQATRMD